MKSLIIALVQCVLFVNYTLVSSVSRINHSDVKLFETPVSYDVETTVLLNEISKKDKEVGYKVKAKLNVDPVWGEPGSEYLLKFHLLEPRLYLRGKHLNANFAVHKSVWDDYSDTVFYAHWKSGLIQNSYLDLKGIPDIINYQKSLISLFQFQIIDGAFNETDITGACDVFYESISEQVFRKIKRYCAGDEQLGGGRARRVVRYTLAAGALDAVYGDEVVDMTDGEELEEPAPGVGGELGVKARSWLRLQRAGGAPPPGPPPPTQGSARPLAAALAELPAHLSPTSLLPVDTDQTDDDHYEQDGQTLEELVESYRPQLQTEEAGQGGAASHAAAALALLPALGAAPAARLSALLAEPRNHPLLPSLCRLLGLTGTLAAHAAADGLLHLGAVDALQPLAGEYLAGLALAPAPDPSVVAAAAALARAARHPDVARAALLAAAATAATVSAPGAALRDQLARALARCEHDECRAAHATALGVLRRPDTAELLLEQAERAGPGAALAALDALDALHAHHAHHAHVVLPPARRLRLERLALRSNRTLEVRGAALDLYVRAGAGAGLGAPPPLAAAPDELRRLYWLRLRQMGRRPPPAPPGWWAGGSELHERRTGWAGAARLRSLQVVAGGLLRRGALALDGPRGELLAVRVWARGLQALAGAGAAAGAAAEDEDEPLSARLELAVGGVPLPPRPLFSGQGELLSLVWAGAASTPTRVVRALWAGGERRARTTLATGAPLVLAARDAHALALDAHAQVSLWARTARGGLGLRAGRARRVLGHVRTSWARLAAHARAHSSPRLRLAAHLDFYDTAALCVRAHLHRHYDRRLSWLQSTGGARDARVTRARNVTVPVAGRTLALGRRNDAACRALGAPGDHDDDDDHDHDRDHDDDDL